LFILVINAFCIHNVICGSFPLSVSHGLATVTFNLLISKLDFELRVVIWATFPPILNIYRLFNIILDLNADTDRQTGRQADIVDRKQ